MVLLGLFDQRHHVTKHGAGWIGHAPDINVRLLFLVGWRHIGCLMLLSECLECAVPGWVSHL